jgi:hypothetical protein
MLWVQIPSPALAIRSVWLYQDSGLKLVASDSDDFAAVAQLVEHFIGNEEVVGSIPTSSSPE